MWVLKYRRIWLLEGIRKLARHFEHKHMLKIIRDIKYMYIWPPFGVNIYRMHLRERCWFLNIAHTLNFGQIHLTKRSIRSNMMKYVRGQTHTSTNTQMHTNSTNAHRTTRKLYGNNTIHNAIYGMDFLGALSARSIHLQWRWAAEHLAESFHSYYALIESAADTWHRFCVRKVYVGGSETCARRGILYSKSAYGECWMGIERN